MTCLSFKGKVENIDFKLGYFLKTIFNMYAYGRVGKECRERSPEIFIYINDISYVMYICIFIIYISFTQLGSIFAS